MFTQLPSFLSIFLLYFHLSCCFLLTCLLPDVQTWFQFFGFFLCCGIFCYGCMFAFVVFALVFAVLSQEIGWEERLRNDLFCVGWDVKP